MSSSSSDRKRYVDGIVGPGGSSGKYPKLVPSGNKLYRAFRCLPGTNLDRDPTLEIAVSVPPGEILRYNHGCSVCVCVCLPPFSLSLLRFVENCFVMTYVVKIKNAAFDAAAGGGGGEFVLPQPTTHPLYRASIFGSKFGNVMLL